MKPMRRIVIFLAGCLGLGILAQAMADEPVIRREIATERWEFQRDGRDWRLSSRQITKLASSHRYVLEGDSADLWRELISTEHYPANTSADQHVLTFIEELQGRCHPLKISHISNGPSSVILEWTGDCRVSGKQYEIRRIDAGPDGYDHLAYGAKDRLKTPEKQQAWLAILRASRLKDIQPSVNRGD